MRAFEDFNSYSSLDDMYTRTGALVWSPTSPPGAGLFHDYPRFAGSGQYLGVIGPGLLGFGVVTGIVGTFDIARGRVIVGFAFMQSSHAEQGELSGMYGDFIVEFMDSTSGTRSYYQCGVGISTYGGAIGIFDYNGYPIFETPSGVVALNAWNYMEIDATVGHSGIIHVRLNGQDVVTCPGDFGSYLSGASSSTNAVRMRSENGWWWTNIDDFYYA